MTTMREFGTRETAALLEDAARLIQKASESPEEEAVHKMRVAIRRFQQSLRLFEQFFRPKGVKRVRSDLRSIMTRAGELRNYDIALGLVGRKPSVRAALDQRRDTAEQELLSVLRDVGEGNLAQQWKKKMEID